MSAHQVVKSYSVQLLAASLLGLWASAAQAQIRGDAAATAAAAALLETVGGRDAWSKSRTFYAEERVFLPSGETAQLRIWRDFVDGSRRIERSSPGARFSEWIAADGGFEVRDGQKRTMSAEELAAERHGLKQEPYAIYRRLALNDPAIRVELREPRALYVYGDEERLLCWFLLDGKRAPISWANFYNGAINQHYYGPTIDAGDINLPKWGVSANGGFRFEYIRGEMQDRAPVPPGS